MDDGLRPVDFIGGWWSVCGNFVLCQQISATLTDSPAESQREAIQGGSPSPLMFGTHFHAHK